MKTLITDLSAGAPGIPLPAAGTNTALRSSVKPIHCSTRDFSRSASASFLSVKTKTKLMSLWRKCQRDLVVIYWNYGNKTN